MKIEKGINKIRLDNSSYICNLHIYSYFGCYVAIFYTTLGTLTYARHVYKYPFYTNKIEEATVVIFFINGRSMYYYLIIYISVILIIKKKKMINTIDNR